MNEGLALRDQAMERLQISGSDFLAEMEREAVRISRRKGTVSVDDLREYAAENGIEPPSPNHWGALFRAEHWTAVGMKHSRIRSNHGRRVLVWRMKR